MGWERRPNKLGAAYFYRSIRLGDRVKKVYYGRGQAGHEAASALELKCKGRMEAKRLLQEARNCTDECDKLANELCEWAEVLLSTSLILTGHRKRRGQWRRINMARKPKVGSRAWEESLVNSPTYARNTILSLAKRAEQGSKEAVENLLAWLEKYPDMRSLVRELDDLATKVERAWVQRMCGADELSKQGVEDDLAALKAELLGPAPSVTDKILASTVLIAHLDFQRAALAASVMTDNPEVRVVREKLLSAAQKRLQDALKGWELHAGKKARGLRPRGNLRIFEPDAVA
jgi:hypothetical protein